MWARSKAERNDRKTICGWRKRDQTNRVSRVSAALDAAESNSQAGAAPGTTGGNDGTTATSFHANKETVGAGALSYRGLERSFHNSLYSANPIFKPLNANLSRARANTDSKGVVDKL